MDDSSKLFTGVQYRKDGFRQMGPIIGGRASINKRLPCTVCGDETDRAFVYRRVIELNFKFSCVCNRCWGLMREIPDEEKPLDLTKILQEVNRKHGGI